jgi:dihydroneopterin aldolase
MTPQDTIFIQELKTSATIGVLEWEKTSKQIILIDLALSTDIRQAALHDDLRQTLDYKLICDQVISLVKTSNFELIETLATAVADHILNNFAAAAVKVTIYKPQAIPQAKTVGISIERTKPSSHSA